MKSYERIKNFSTSVSAESSIGEIETMLTKFGATKIMKEFGPTGMPTVLVFAIPHPKGQGEVPIKLPMNAPGLMGIFKKLVSDRKLPRKYWGGEWAEQQAARTGWRILKDWLDAQLALISIEMVKIHEVFLPYIYNHDTGRTLYETLEKREFNLEQLDYKEKKPAALQGGI